MNARITDAEALSALRPLEVVAYLRSTGWAMSREKAGHWSTWLHSDADGDEFEVTVPLNHQFRDFSARMGDVLRLLETFEGRSQLQIFRDLLVTGADVIRLRLTDSELADASVPLEEGATFIQKAKDMVLSSACAAVNPRMYYPSRKSTQATDYIRRARLGQTEPGSFIITIISPVPPSLAGPGGQMFELEEPFERRVTRMLAVALSSVRQAAEDAATTGNVDSFVRAVPDGVSANLCDALAGMGSSTEGDRSLDIQFSWSRSRPLASEAEVPSQIRLNPDAFPVIRQAAVYLKETSRREEFEIRGSVVKLERMEGTDIGKATIHGLIDDQPRKVVVELKGAEYHKAVAAHDEFRFVRCSGVLAREGRGFRLYEPYGFDFEDDDPQ
jgi:hypothetical protein